MNLRVAILVMLQALLTACAILMSVWARMPWVTIVAMAILGLSAIAAQIAGPVLDKFRKVATGLAWFCTLLVPASLLLMTDQGFTFETYLDKYYATLAWLIAASILPATSGLFGSPSMERWKLPVIVWAFGGAVIWVGTAYMRNQAGAFYAGVSITAALLVFCHIWFRLSTIMVQVVNTALLLLVGLPVADFLFHPSYRLGTQPDLRRKLYTYEAAERDPADFAHWWNYYLAQWRLTERDILLPPGDGLPFRLRPGSRSQFMQGRIAINRLGFRGPEIAQPKGDRYRIVCLGASTTFGITFEAADRPWPETLENLIRERLDPHRPVEVINAGVAGYTLSHNLIRFARDILPLQPDMIICYHGINGFCTLDENLPPLVGKPPPVYQHRAIHLLADCEHRLRMIGYERQRLAKETDRPETPIDLMQTEYANEYRRLIELAQSNGIRLVLATFSMAANEQSDAGLVRFYGTGYRQVPRLIQANELHSAIVRGLCEQHKEVCLVDTRAALDGCHTNFFDLVHFAPEGKVKMAETMFSGIRDVLQEDLKATSKRLSFVREPRPAGCFGGN